MENATSTPLAAPAAKPATPTRLTREELYELVWSEAMRTLAPKFGMSDVGLAKVCRRMRIPRPGLGYWAKKAAGQPIKRARLPVILQSARPAVFEFVAREARNHPEAVEERNSEPAKVAALPSPPISVAKSLRGAHPDVERTAHVFRNLKPGSKGLLSATDKGCLPLKVAPRTLPRALRIADAIRKECEDRGYGVTFDGVEYGSSVPRCRITVGQDSVSWLLEEEFERVRHVPTPNELLEKAKYSWHHIPTYDHHAVGDLALRILDAYYWGSESSIRRSWVDGKRHRVEACLNAFFDGVVRVSELKKQRRLESEEAERRRAEEQRVAWEREERRREEEARIRDLDAKLVAWTRSRDLRDFLGAVEAQARTRGLAADSPLAAWIDWGRRHADTTDPLPVDPIAPTSDPVDRSPQA